MMENERGLCCAYIIKSRLNFLKSSLDQLAKMMEASATTKGLPSAVPLLFHSC